jgi:diguanylate cyclase (GGDEF)-like protein
MSAEHRIRIPRSAVPAVGGSVMGAVGGLILATTRHVEVDPTLGVPLTAAVVAALYLLAEVSMFHVEVRGQAFSVTLSDLPLVLGIFLLTPEWLLLVALVPVILVGLLRRTDVSKALFNVGLLTLEVAVATLLLDALAPTRTPDVWSWAATFGSVLVVDLLGTAAVVAAMHLLGSRPDRTDVLQMVLAVSVSGLLSTTLALMAIIVLHSSAAGLVLLAVLAGVVALAHRAYYRLLRQHANLNRLFAFTQTVGSAQDSEGVVAELLTQARELLAAESAVLRLRVTEPTSPDDLVADARPVVLPRGTRDPVQRRWLAKAGLRDALLVPLRDHDDVVAVLQVGNRLGVSGTFTRDDLALLQTLTAHAEVLWRNGRLLEQLRHDAQHDSLTGLANRSLFIDKLTSLLAAPTHQTASSGTRAAVLLLDLDRFKEVNDALGHPVGDVLLQQVADRLHSHVPSGAVVARLGGDEFAVLIPACRAAEDALATARAARASLTGAFEVAGTFLEVGASVGVAMIPADGDEAPAVLAHADVAMYAAKRSATGVARYQREHDTSSTDRLALAAELRGALLEDQISLHYQPKANLRTGRTVGFEALARWQHPTRGLVMPDEFIPLAEHTGLIGPLTKRALQLALAECRSWLTTAPGVGVAVNLTPRRLLEPSLPASIADLLSGTGVPADLLTLEITESSIMSDPEAAGRALRQLRELGVRLSIDDFGTGYSSLAYLQRLPVDEVKIDKSFVIPMAMDPSAAAIVRAIVDLAHTLDLSVVAEGVEDDQTRGLLADLGCDVVQGYGLARPMPAESVADWLRAHRRMPDRTELRRVRAL